MDLQLFWEQGRLWERSGWLDPSPALEVDSAAPVALRRILPPYRALRPLARTELAADTTILLGDILPYLGGYTPALRLIPLHVGYILGSPEESVCLLFGSYPDARLSVSRQEDSVCLSLGNQTAIYQLPPIEQEWISPIHTPFAVFPDLQIPVRRISSITRAELVKPPRPPEHLRLDGEGGLLSYRPFDERAKKRRQDELSQWRRWLRQAPAIAEYTSRRRSYTPDTLGGILRHKSRG